jgi:hypothetical protein
MLVPLIIPLFAISLFMYSGLSIKILFPISVSLYILEIYLFYFILY